MQAAAASWPETSRAGAASEGLGAQAAAASRTEASRAEASPSAEQPRDESRHERYALLIDGDVFGPLHWSAMLPALREKRPVGDAFVFAPPAFAEKPNWKQAMASLGIGFVPVPRRARGGKDPNDLAIAAEAASLFARGGADGVALAVQDADFVYLAEYLRERLCKVTLVVPAGRSLALRHAFQTVDADVVLYHVAEGGPMPMPKKKAVLHPTGESSIEDFDPEPREFELLDDARIVEVLMDLGYIAADTDPRLPAIAKFFHTNVASPLTAWPEACAMAELLHLLRAESRQAWRQNPGDLVFVFPRGGVNTLNQSGIDKYGSRVCADMARAGGPFITRDAPSHDLVGGVLRRLGFLDDHLNSSLSEAIDVFCDVGLNRRTLTSLGLGISPRLSVHARLSLIHCALVDSRATGSWQMAAPDTKVRQVLVGEGLIGSTRAAPVEVFEALKVYARRMQLETPSSYNKLAHAAMRHWYRRQPSLRR